MWNALRERAARFWAAINPSAPVWRGVVAAIVIAALVAFAYTGWYARTGLGKPLDILILTGGGAIAILVFGALSALIMTLLRVVPRMRTGLVLASGVALVAFWQISLVAAGWLALGTLIAEALLGGALAAVLSGRFREGTSTVRTVIVGSLVVGLAANIAFIGWLAWPGRQADPLGANLATPASPAPLDAPDPSAAGTYTWQTLTYGSGADRRRPEFGADVTIETSSVDATPFVDIGEIKARNRSWYWGFGADAFPRNGRVWYPDGVGPFPLVLIVHGNDNMTDPADEGYGYLGELLASRGFIAVSVDETFFGVYFPTGPLTGENDARGWMLLKHLELWREWNALPGHPFAGKVDLERIALVGHSRGGEAVAIAAAFNTLDFYPDDATIPFDFGFGIQSVVAIAPSDGQYKPTGQSLPLKNVNYLLLQGSQDGDVSDFLGLRQYNRVKFDRHGPWFKALLYAERANHGQFNTSWGRVDAGMPTGLLLETKPLLAPHDQRQIATTFITAYLEATLLGQHAYRSMFRDPRRAAAWLPATRYFSQYQDASFQVLCDHEEDIDVNSTTLKGGRIEATGFENWRQCDLKLRGGGSQQNQAVYLQWQKSEQPSQYLIHLSEPGTDSLILDPDSSLVFNLCDARSRPINGASSIDVTVELADHSGIRTSLRLSQFLAVQPPFHVRFTKFPPREKSRYAKDTEPVLQTFEIPLTAFTMADPSIDLSQLATLTFHFDRPAAGAVYLDEIGFSSN